MELEGGGKVECEQWISPAIWTKMGWDVKFGCSFVVLDHMPRESLATVILKHFQTEATLGHGVRYMEQDAAVVAVGLTLRTGPTCPGNKSMPGQVLWYEVCGHKLSGIQRTVRDLNGSWILTFHLGSLTCLWESSVFVYPPRLMRTDTSNELLGTRGIKGVLIKSCSGWGQWGMWSGF